MKSVEVVNNFTFILNLNISKANLILVMKLQNVMQQNIKYNLFNRIRSLR